MCKILTNKISQIKHWILSIYINRWIECSECLPEIKGDDELFWVLMILENGEKYITVAYRCNSSFNWTNNDTWFDFDNEIKYWKRMKYPKLPKEINNKQKVINLK